MPGSPWTKYRLLSWTMHELCIFDDAYWLKNLTEGLPGVLPVPRRFVQPVGSSLLTPDFYRLTNTDGTIIEVGPDEMVHFHGYNPDDPRVGSSPIETLRAILAEEYSATSYREQMWRNGARVGGYIHRPKDAPRWSPDARNRFKTDWQSQYSGDGTSVGSSPLLEDGMEFRPSGVTPREAQYVESRQLTRVEVAIAYHVPPPMFGSLEAGAQSAMAELHRMLYQDCLGPTLVALSQDIERQLLTDLDPGAADGSVYVEFNLAEKLRGSFAEQAAAISASVGGPWMTRSEARAMHNLRHLEEADELITPLNVTAGGLASPRDTAPDDPHNEESNGQVPQPRAPKHFLTVGARP
jgi:HK97 family phage portal protein